MPAHSFCLWHRAQSGRFSYNWDIVRHDSIVVITAGESMDSNNPPQRFIGEADILVKNIAPHDGRVDFRMDIVWDSPLDVWTTITVFDPQDGYGFGDGFPN